MGDHAQWQNPNDDFEYKGFFYHLGWTQIGNASFQGAYKITGTAAGPLANEMIRNVPTNYRSETLAISFAEQTLKAYIDSGAMQAEIDSLEAQPRS